MQHSDPFNLIITGVGGQGNLVASQVLGRALLKKGYLVTVGETYGLSQRGGAVTSHIRISKKERLGPRMPHGQAHAILGLEPVETLRVMPEYGNSRVVTIVNSRPVHPMGVIAGEQDYPDFETLKKTLSDLSKTLYWVDATDIAMELGNAIMANVVMMGALAGAGVLPLSTDEILDEIKLSLPESKWEVNRTAFTRGLEAVATKQ